MFILSINTMLVVYVVFMAVILLIVLFIVVGKALDDKKAQKAALAKTGDPKADGISEAGKVAVAMALHLYYGVHDNESDVITLKRVQSRYSPWSSKIYGIQ